MTILVIGAGGGFARVLSDSGVADSIGRLGQEAHLSPLLYGWLVSAFIRVATGSATVAITTASGLLIPVMAAHPELDQTHKALIVVAIGCGSLFLSHLNDSGFWIVKDSLGLTVGQTLRTWTVCETILSVSALIFTLILSLFACFLASVAAQEKADSAATIRKLEEKWTESYKNRQIDMLSSMLADDFVITVEDGNTYSKSGYISHTADASVQVDVAEMSDLKVRMHGNIAVVTGAYHERGKSNGKPYEYRDRLTDVWMKVGNKWQVIASHYSVPLK